jgi:hypothetical protein
MEVDNQPDPTHETAALLGLPTNDQAPNDHAQPEGDINNMDDVAVELNLADDEQLQWDAAAVPGTRVIAFRYALFAPSFFH